ncbi:MAG: DUF4433 domain-containing protein [Chloroflexi bacterium]|nr:DUF4433 domain-containing protein [Chloroflexota bacterium]
MTQRPKADISALASHLSGLERASWMRPSRRWWPKYLFHCTDILNIVNILRYEELLSRTQAQAMRRLQVDIASPAIIQQTRDEWLDHVRLYFRPRTPTQYVTEGFRPIDQWEYGAHCPVPVYLLFKALPVLSRMECLFTEGNLASSGTVPSGSVEAFKEIPFELVYHDSPWDAANEAKIRYHRCAEVLVPKRLELTAVALVACRSQAEYDTLLYLLPPGTRAQWVNKIGVRPNLRLFEKRWTFVERVEASASRLLFRFSKETRTPGPFDTRVKIVETASGREYDWYSSAFQANDVLDLSLRNLEHPEDYSVRLLLDEQLAFATRHQEEQLPF